MAGALIAVLLVASLLLAHFAVQARPISSARPLDIDSGLPLPEAGQASTVFSLTALFGAYFAIYILLGFPALMGVATGTTISLFAIRRWVLRSGATTFEGFLSSVLEDRGRSAVAFGLFLVAVQCAYATSELLILREISRVLLGLRGDHATLLAITTGLVGYFYVLFGGYLAVFRTDVLQFALVLIMALVFAAFAIAAAPSDATPHLLSRPGYWELPFTAHSVVKHVYQFVVGAIMGFGFLVVAPDTWKRVFIVTAYRKQRIGRFLAFIGVGLSPFVILLPVALHMTPVPDGVVDTGSLTFGFPDNSALFVVGALGLVACFLSSFDSALLSSVHVALVLQRSHKVVDIELTRFHWLMATTLVAIFFLFVAGLSVGNPYLLANVLLGAYAIAAGVMAGTSARPAILPTNAALWILVVGFTVWFMSLVSVVGLPRAPVTYQVNTVPPGAGLFVVTTFVCWMLTRGKHTHV